MAAIKKYGQKTRRQSLRIPEKLDDALRRKAKTEKVLKSEVIVTTLADALNVDMTPDAPASVFE